MKILIIPIFIGLILLSCGIVFFIYLAKNNDLNSSDEMSLMPLEEEYEHKNSRS